MAQIDIIKREWPVAHYVDILRRHKGHFVKRYHLASLGVFGSYIRNEQRAGSDLDVLVAFTRTPTLFTLVELEDELSALLGLPVDLVVKDDLTRRIGQRILAEVIEL